MANRSGAATVHSDGRFVEERRHGDAGWQSRDRWPRWLILVRMATGGPRLCCAVPAPRGVPLPTRRTSGGGLGAGRAARTGRSVHGDVARPGGSRLVQTQQEPARSAGPCPAMCARPAETPVEELQLFDGSFRWQHAHGRDRGPRIGRLLLSLNQPRAARSSNVTVNRSASGRPATKPTTAGGSAGGRGTAPGRDTARPSRGPPVAIRTRMSQPASDPAIASQVTMAPLPDESPVRMYGRRPGTVCRTGPAVARGASSLLLVAHMLPAMSTSAPARSSMCRSDLAHHARKLRTGKGRTPKLTIMRPF